MRHGILAIGHHPDMQEIENKGKHAKHDDFVLEKSIFNNVFEKDIRRVFMYKKAERIAKAIHLVAPAFAESDSLKNRIDAIAVGLVDAAVLAPSVARNALSRELLTLSSILSIARTSGLLSPMNADLIMREVHYLLQEVAAYEDPRISLEEAPTLSSIAKRAQKRDIVHAAPMIRHRQSGATTTVGGKGENKGHLKDRRDTILSIIGKKGSVSIKDISSMIRGVSEKTIQRELLSLVESGEVVKMGERRWSTYQLAR